MSWPPRRSAVEAVGHGSDATGTVENLGILGEVLGEGRLAAGGVSDEGDAHMGRVR